MFTEKIRNSRSETIPVSFTRSLLADHDYERMRKFDYDVGKLDRRDMQRLVELKKA
jgi:hypothetical protein